ncbi:hypothetical protein ADIARSV_0876 [Arcticibacter svalbardensis MN12-7]|uniref:Uncharacterized protein n=1 Tax=Arcticibacter svalbardensis MN12-7 TaxID=1150600 RepID=R9GVZ5_9SPHI|nr:hypothetical protein ADIARSV_0876 [Arcticibacter svalbardensis MN12-7]
MCRKLAEIDFQFTTVKNSNRMALHAFSLGYSDRILNP